MHMQVRQVRSRVRKSNAARARLTMGISRISLRRHSHSLKRRAAISSTMLQAVQPHARTQAPPSAPAPTRSMPTTQSCAASLRGSQARYSSALRLHATVLLAPDAPLYTQQKIRWTKYSVTVKSKHFLARSTTSDR